MSAAIAIRPRSSDDKLIVGENGKELSSFILQVRDEMSPWLMQKLERALADLGIETSLVAVEPLADYMPTHVVARYEGMEAAIDHPPEIQHVLPEAGRNAAARPLPLVPPRLPQAAKLATRHTETRPVRVGGAQANPSANSNASRDALARGEARLVKWTRDGSLVDGKRLAEAWGMTRQGLDKARERGDIFSVRVGGLHYYAEQAEHFKRADLAQVNRALGGIDPNSKLIFLKRQHGALGGRTPAEATEDGRLADVLRLARDWANN
jgi:hypothetical protein